MRQHPVGIILRGTKHGWHIGWQESNVASCCGLSSVPPVQMAFYFHRPVEMMQTNNMLLRAVLWDRAPDLPHIK